MENKRYQVFISSTYSDLKKERAEVTQALLELDCIPSGMEAFPAANDSQWTWIKKVIEECDYYILILGGKYGTINKETGLSYTEMEYDYAISKGIPVISFIIEDTRKLLADKVETDDSEKREKLQKFKEKVKTKLCKFYTNPDDLGSKVSRSISQLKKSEPRIGWVRADSLKSYSSNEDMIKLMNENKELQEEIANLKNEVKFENKLLSQDEELFEVGYALQYCNSFGEKFWEIYDKIKLTWKELFIELGTIMLKIDLDISDSDPISRYIEGIIQKDPENKYNLDLNHGYINVRIDYKTLIQILIQFKALGYLNNTGSYWEMTTEGENYLLSILVVQSSNK